MQVRDARTPATETDSAPAEFDDTWRAWIAENLAHDAKPEDLLSALVFNSFHPADAQREIAKAKRSPYLHPARRLAQRVAKRDWCLDVQHKSRRFRTSSKPGIERRHKLSRADFLDDFYSANRPVVITGMMEDWPALLWSADHLRQRFADRLVQVQTGRDENPRYEIEAPRHEETMRLGDFMHRIVEIGECNDIYMTARNGSVNQVSLPELWDGIVQIPEYLEPFSQNRGLV